MDKNNNTNLDKNNLNRNNLNKNNNLNKEKVYLKKDTSKKNNTYDTFLECDCNKPMFKKSNTKCIDCLYKEVKYLVP